MIICAVPLISLVVSGGNDQDVEVGDVDPGQLHLGLEVHEVQVDTISEVGGQISFGIHHLPYSFHEG